PRVATAAAQGGDQSRAQGAVSRLIQVYANRGHLVANIDPLGLMQRPRPRVLDLEYFGLTQADLDHEFFTGTRSHALPRRMKLKDIVAQLEHIYCDRIGAEFAHVSDTEERLWLQEKFQEGRLQHRFSPVEQENILWQLTTAEGLERYLHTKYVGQKRFSLEGGDALIPLLDDLIQQGGSCGVEEMVIGMAHRGRLNVLVNVLGKSPAVLFSEFEGHYDLAQVKGSGDVKYHKGFSADLKTPGGNVHVVLAFNPSHLEVVNPVVEGSVRARQERRGDTLGEHVIPVQIHGDAAFAGQGVVMETLQLSQARAFYTGGTIHLIINNQVGFTTSNPADARSTLYCSDVAKMIEAPILHVNADDPEAVVFVTRLALAYRQKFHKDIVVDLVCYRRHGHNEADEPAATQPVMYQAIRKHPTARQLYAERLEREQVIPPGKGAALAEQYRVGLDEGRQQARAFVGTSGNKFTVDWTHHLDASSHEYVHTGAELETLKRFGHLLTQVPADVTLHPRVSRIVEDRRRMYAGEMPLDWGAAEILAYASLLKDGHPIRITGQDSGRGTFFHRHAVLHDQATGRTHVALTQLFDGQPRFQVTDSVLSEEAVMGFEYGYSTTDPNSLVIWEGQFGDFANGAQVIIDQFISSGESKWGRICGMTLLLPHGYEGQGPEHSSARLERFLQLCAEYNIQVCVPSTPGQMFHMLRRQMRRALRKPLVVMTPKSLLRHKLAVTDLSELVTGHFNTVIDEVDPIVPDKVRRVVLCSGKVYYDLLEQRRADGVDDVAILRIEQLYPFPSDEYEAAIDRYRNAAEVVWCQEEPQNQGAWYQIRHRLQEKLLPKHLLLYAGRAGAAAPAVGVFQVHVEQQKAMVRAALHAIAGDDTHRATHRLNTQAIRKNS
ncbi:MAG: 2-oxoglutarate dehydrogenase E1 component, partial [Gammaproteobacteria bacterium]|nr:2-oxoglutarate dehydrogenase E1 component [Gammaproteobacteria bacterium]